MSSLPSQYVKRGMWVNQQDGPVLGRVITTDTRTGTLVVALLAMITAFGTTHLWNLITFAYHQSRVKRHPDGLFRQQQALLRTLPTPSSVVSDWAKLWWSWRRRADPPLMRSLPHFVLAVLFTVATIAVSLSVSYIVTTTNVQVLIESPSCVPMNWDALGVNFSQALMNYNLDLSKASRDYAEACYGETSQGTASELCKTFIRPKVHFEKTRVPCPFESSICAKINLPGLALDSQMVDLNDGLGLNLPHHERVKYRKRTSCALLNLEGRTGIVKVNNSKTYCGEDQRLKVFFGQSPVSQGGATVDFSLASSNLSTSFSSNTNMKYGDPSFAQLNELVPLPEMENSKADTSILFLLKNRVYYTQPINDPMFSAHVPSTAYYTGYNITYYISDFPMSVIGCESQYQFCFARPNQQDFCTSLNYLPAQVTPTVFPGSSKLQLAALNLLRFSALMFDTATSMDYLKANLLRSGSGYIPSLPDDQWISEIEGWESHVWSSQQMVFMDYAMGFTSRTPAASELMHQNITSADSSLCRMQRMRSSNGFVNISVFGLAFTLTFCVLVTALDISLLRFLIFLQGFRRALAPRIDAWIQDGVYQLQRRAYEAHGKGRWESLQEEIPLTERNAELFSLPIESLPAVSPIPSANHACKCQSVQTHVQIVSPSSGTPVDDNSITNELIEAADRDPGHVSAEALELVNSSASNGTYAVCSVSV